MKLIICVINTITIIRRPPHGGRGLKYHNLSKGQVVVKVAPRTGGVD